MRILLIALIVLFPLASYSQTLEKVNLVKQEYRCQKCNESITVLEYDLANIQHMDILKIYGDRIFKDNQILKADQKKPAVCPYTRTTNHYW